MEFGDVLKLSIGSVCLVWIGYKAATLLFGERPSIFTGMSASDRQAAGPTGPRAPGRAPGFFLYGLYIIMSERAGQIVVVVFGRELVIGRVTSLVVAAIMLVELLPLLCLIALAIKVESSKSPLLFVQDRLDRRGRRFRLMKFRTMDNCQRITSVGRVLRRTSLDELPQFWGVILGGYRPKTDLQS